MPCHATCGPAFHLVLVPARIILCSCLYPQPSLLVLLYTSPSISFTPATTSLSFSSLPLPDFSTYDPLSIFRHRLLEKILRLLPPLPLSPPPPSCPSFLRCLAFFKASPRWLFFGPRRVLGTVLVPLARAEKWRLERTTCAARQIKDG